MNRFLNGLFAVTFVGNLIGMHLQQNAIFWTIDDWILRMAGSALVGGFFFVLALILITIHTLFKGKYGR